ncbi:MAG: triple tyrosine motif-containing protein [Paludibacteraceae bacterium]
MKTETGLYSSKTVAFNHQIPHLRIERVDVRDKKTYQRQDIQVSDSLKVKIPFAKNSIAFTVYFPYYSNMNDVMFRYRLDGLGKKWGALITQNVKQYEYLSQGNYTFHAQVLTNEGKIVGELQYHFTVKPPFYWSVSFRLIYLLIFLSNIIFYFL